MDGTEPIINQPDEGSFSKPDYDVAIVGAGIKCLATAVALKRLVPDWRYEFVKEALSWCSRWSIPKWNDHSRWHFS